MSFNLDKKSWPGIKFKKTTTLFNGIFNSEILFTFQNPSYAPVIYRLYIDSELS